MSSVLTNHKVEAEIAKLLAETSKINTENRWHPLAIGAGIFAAGGAFMGGAVAVIKYLGGG